MAGRSGLGAQLSAGLYGGLLGGVTIWVYELVDQSLLRQVTAPDQIVENTAALVFGPRIREFGPLAYGLGVLIHFATALIWGVLFALIWPFLRARKVEATLAALFFGVFAWVVMHNLLLARFSPNPPSYTVLTVINGFMSHTVGFAVPMALLIKARLGGS
jgi:hypothetical protein